MKYSEFLGHVQNRAQMGRQSDAVSAVRATLETLGERLAGGQADHLAAQLPEEIGYYLRQGGDQESFELDTFYERVAEREGVDLPDAVYHSKIVMGLVNEAISDGESRDMRAQLPDEYDDLFDLNGGWKQN